MTIGPNIRTIIKDDTHACSSDFIDHHFRSSLFRLPPLRPAPRPAPSARIDAKAMTLTLKNGSHYMLPATFKDPGIKVGEKVTIAYEMVGKKHQATAVTLTQ
jgi:hypothetical protein